MRANRAYTKLLSLFVVAFLCLNAGSVYCLAFCAKAAMTKGSHCPLKKQGAGCPHSKRTTTSPGNSAADNTSTTCVVLPVSVFAAPLESNISTSIDTQAVLQVDKPNLAPAVLIRSRQIPKFYYRPPPNDERASRVRNQVFRI